MNRRKIVQAAIGMVLAGWLGGGDRASGQTLPAAPAAGADFRRHLGLQLYSLRALILQNPPQALDLAKSYGCTEVETAGTGTISVEAFARLLRSRGLTPIGGHFLYERLRTDLPGVIRDARTLGLTYVICPILPHPPGGFDEAAARGFATEFNAWGAALRAAGLHFAYHTHGVEFDRPGAVAGETGFDTLVRATDPALVSYEMDVFWVYQAGQDPVKLLTRYPGRWIALHLKDLRRGVKTPVDRKITAADNAPVGQGQIDWPAVIGTAERIGVIYYFIEDETADPYSSVPLSMRYLRALAL